MSTLLCFLLNLFIVLPTPFQAALDDRFSNRLLLQMDGHTSSPTVIITGGPKDGERFNSSNVSVHFRVHSEGNDETRCSMGYMGEIYRDWEICHSPYTVQLDEDGIYTFRIMVYAGGGVDAERIVSREWILDRIPPQTTIVAPYPEDGNSPNAEFHFIGTDDGSKIEHYDCSLDRAAWVPCTSPHNITGLKSTQHVFCVRAVDLAGNPDPSPAHHIWSVYSSNHDDDPSFQQLGGRSDNDDIYTVDADNSNEGVVERTRTNWLFSLLLFVCVLIAVFLMCLGCYKCSVRARRQAAGGGDGGGSQLTSLESDVLSGHVDLSGFSSMWASLPENLRRFRYQEIWAATGGFPENGILGEGGFGKVYSGTLKDGRAVAIKKLEHSGLQGDREFFVEVTTLTRARHHNIIDLLGICVEDGHRVCVFELMDWGSARSIMDERDPKFTWEARLSVALGAARGLACLHESVDPPIVHRDLKSENILLDRHGEACISDFGLCTLAHHEARQRRSRSNVTMTVGTIRGTFGYLAPEVIGSGRISTKSDVYAFGVFLLELLTGRRPIETSRPSREQDLVKWILKHIDQIERILETVDPIISYDVCVVQIMAFVELAASCLHFSPSNRPSALEAAVRLEELMRFQNKTGKKSSDTKPEGKMGALCLNTKLSDSSGMIPTGTPLRSCHSEGELTPHAVPTPIASTSSGRIMEIGMHRRAQDSYSEALSPHETFSPNNRDHWDDAGPSTASETAIP